MVRFNNVPAGVRLFATVDAITGQSGASLATLIRAASLPANDPFQRAEIHGQVRFQDRPLALSEIQLEDGCGSAVWEIDRTSEETPQFLTVGLAVAYKATPLSGLPGLGTAQAAGAFAPLSTVTTAAAGPVPRFAPVYASLPLFSIIGG